VHFLWIMNVGIVSRKLLDIMRSKPSSKCINVSYSCLLKPFVFSRKWCVDMRASTSEHGHWHKLVQSLAIASLATLVVFLGLSMTKGTGKRISSLKFMSAGPHCLLAQSKYLLLIITLPSQPCPLSKPCNKLNAKCTCRRLVLTNYNRLWACLCAVLVCLSVSHPAGPSFPGEEEEDVSLFL